MEDINLSCKIEDKPILNFRLRWIIVIVVIVSVFFIFKGFIVSQILNRATSYYGFGMLNDAIREYKKVLLLDSDNEEALNWLAYSYLKLGDNENAKRFYERAIELNPYDYFARLDLGLMYVGEGKFKEAKKIFEAATRANSQGVKIPKVYLRDYKMCLEWLARVQIKLNEINGAIDTYSKILQIDPENERIRAKLNELKRKE